MYDFLFVISELFSLALTAQAPKAKRVKTCCYQEGYVSFSQDFRGKREYFLVSTKLDTFCYLAVQTAPCYVPSF